VISVDEVPMTVTGKTQKFKLRDQAIDRLDLRNVVVDTA
jgi:acyl-CoA synthetase (AMP-forming)/AMP-acid ligase II